jgi:inner membrane protein
MDNVCHTLVGVAVARTGFHRKTALATSTAVIAANLADIDVLVFATDVPSVAFRRGITHGLPAQVLLPIACAGFMWWLGRRRTGKDRAARFDYLNSYGIRLLSPMSPRWFYGDAVFIVDVWLWIVLGAGTLFAGKSRPRYAVVALTIASLYIAGMLLSARAARAIVQDAWMARTGEAPRALMVGPVPLNPFRRTIILDAGDRYYEGVFRWMPTQIAFAETATPKNESRPEIARASEDRRVHGILIWARFPVWDTREVPEGLEVSVRDMRFRALGRGGFTASTIVPH